MVIKVGLMTVCVVAALGVVSLFFCSLETGPITALRLAKSARYRGLDDGKKRFRFW